MAEEHELTWRLSDPGMDLLERAGLAGLHMALRAASEAGVKLSPLTWTDADLTRESVTVRWCGVAKPGFVKLMEWAWQVRDGVLYLPAVHDFRERAQWWHRVPIHNGIMGTFFQSSRIQPRARLENRIIQLDEQREISVRFFALNTPIKPHRDVQDLFARSGPCRGNFLGPGAKLSTWVTRGLSARYPSDGHGKAWQDKAWRGPAEQAFLLMLVPIVCLYFRLQGKGNNWVFVTPDVRDLAEFDASRRRIALNEDFIDVASLGDAGLRFQAEYSTRSMRKALRSSGRASVLGITSYFHKANATRKGILDLSDDFTPIKRYRILHRELPNAYRTTEPEVPAEVTAEKPQQGEKRRAKPTGTADRTLKAAGRIVMPAARGRIADNLLKGCPWYADLAIPTVWDHEKLEWSRKHNKELNESDGRSRPTSHETILFDSLRNQGSQLMNLISEDKMWNDPRDRVFLEAFWETLSRCYYLEKKAAEQRGGTRSAHDRINDFNAKIHRELLQSATHLLLRKTLSEFFAVPAALPRSESLQNNVAAVWQMIDADWRKGRDLSMLALMTYRARKKRTSLGKTEPTAQKGT